MQLDRLTIKSQEALQEAQRIAHELFASGGGWRASAAGPDRPGRQPHPGSAGEDRRAGRQAQARPRTANWPAATRSRASAAATCSSARSLKKALDAAQTEAGKLKDDYISTEHLLLGLLDEGGASLKKIFQTHGLKRDTGAAGAGGPARQPARHRRQSRRTSSRRSKNMAATSPRWRGRARLIRSSAATRKSAA